MRYFKSLLQSELELHNSQMLVEMRALFKFCQGAAHIWDVHELGLAKQERALHEGLDECRHQHDNENQVGDTRGPFILAEDSCWQNVFNGFSGHSMSGS